jgi:hypothetical protein
MPNPSFWPLILALGLLVVTMGGLLGLRVVFPGVLLTFVGLFGWAFEPTEG